MLEILYNKRNKLNTNAGIFRIMTSGVSTSYCRKQKYRRLTSTYLQTDIVSSPDQIIDFSYLCHNPQLCRLGCFFFFCAPLRQAEVLCTHSHPHLFQFQPLTEVAKLVCRIAHCNMQISIF